eukprot:s4967_g10.t1
MKRPAAAAQESQKAMKAEKLPAAAAVQKAMKAEKAMKKPSAAKQTMKAMKTETAKSDEEWPTEFAERDPADSLVELARQRRREEIWQRYREKFLEGLKKGVDEV